MIMSEKLRVAIKLSPLRAYVIARDAEIKSSTLSKWINGIESIRPDDPRLARLAQVMGMSEEECFEAEPVTPRQEQQLTVS